MHNKENGILLQGFEWYLSSEPHHWITLKTQAKELANHGFSAIWLPPAYKGSAGKDDVGYGVYDLYDLGEFDQKQSVPTKYGTLKEYLQLIDTLHTYDIEVYADIVLNQKMGADETEDVLATQVEYQDRDINEGEEHIIAAWTKFTFPNRKGKHSAFQWNWTHFDGCDFDDKQKQSGIFRFQHKEWDHDVDAENGNYDYLMGADLDFSSSEVLQELDTWGKWYTEKAHLDGYRMDALKHVHATFPHDWLESMRTHANKELFAVGEYWSPDINALMGYLAKNQYTLSLFDVPLHFHFQQASCANGNYNMADILNQTLVQQCPKCAVTFVDNHDTQPSQALSSWVADWFKPLAYSILLLRKDGYPCIFYGDYYGIPHDQITPKKDWLDILCMIRKQYAYGIQNDYFDHESVIGWTREGDEQHPDGCACLMSDSIGGKKQMYIGKTHANETYVDILFHNYEVVIDDMGMGTFVCDGGSVSVYIKSSKLSSHMDTPSS